MSFEWRPNPGAQTQFLASPSFEVLYGGAAGGGKTEALVVDPLRYIDQPRFRALYLRRTYPELERSGIEVSRRLYPLLGGEFNEAKKYWRFKSGAVVEFGHCEHLNDVDQYRSAEYQRLYFDELTTFLEHQYIFLLSRLRSSSGIPVGVRSGTNPGGEGHEWVMRRFAPWLDSSPEYKGPRAEPGQIIYYHNAENGEVLCDSGNGALSRQFIPAKVTDNPALMNADPGYVDRLGSLDVVNRRRLRDGDWRALEAPGALWTRKVLSDKRVTHAPDLQRIVVAIDPSGSGKKTADECGIIVAGIGLCSCKGKPERHGFVIEDCSGRFPPREMAERAIDAYRRHRADKVIAEANFGAQMIEELLRTVDPHVPYLAVHASRGKIVRAEPIASLYAAGEVHHVGGFFALEDELCSYTQTSSVSPGRLDALVWSLTELMGGAPAPSFGDARFRSPRPVFGAAMGDDGGSFLSNRESSGVRITQMPSSVTTFPVIGGNGNGRGGSGF